MFVDKAIITVKGGNGGNGCCSFRREKFVPKGGPDGGDGGSGGNVIIETTQSEQSLVSYVYNRHFRGDDGPHGKGKTLHGRRAKDTIIKVPAGTVITNADTKEFIVDLSRPGMSFVIAHGGKGGRGNARFASSVNRAPRQCEEGELGEEFRVELELKMIADVGLVGFPNAGKSTLLGRVSHAQPKVAAYPFTTLHPVIGTIDFPDFSKMTIADIPGLIDGAHDNIGLGHSFLRHIERTRILVYMLDMGAVDGRCPCSDLEHLRNELELYMKGLSGRPCVIVANKMDLEQSKENLELLMASGLVTNLDVIPISAATDEDENKLIAKLKQMLDKETATPDYY
ncbi:MAG: GTPase ObgE [Victivallales bacterium]|nr:GTPase ObgE [Victivallales bacterium]